MTLSQNQKLQNSTLNSTKKKSLASSLNQELSMSWSELRREKLSNMIWGILSPFKLLLTTIAFLSNKLNFILKLKNCWLAIKRLLRFGTGMTQVCLPISSPKQTLMTSNFVGMAVAWSLLLKSKRRLEPTSFLVLVMRQSGAHFWSSWPRNWKSQRQQLYTRTTNFWQQLISRNWMQVIWSEPQVLKPTCTDTSWSWRVIRNCYQP